MEIGYLDNFDNRLYIDEIFVVITLDIRPPSCQAPTLSQAPTTIRH